MNSREKRTFKTEVEVETKVTSYFNQFTCSAKGDGKLTFTEPNTAELKAKVIRDDKKSSSLCVANAIDMNALLELASKLPENSSNSSTRTKGQGTFKSDITVHLPILSKTGEEKGDIDYTLKTNPEKGETTVKFKYKSSLFGNTSESTVKATIHHEDAQKNRM